MRKFVIILLCLLLVGCSNEKETVTKTDDEWREYSNELNGQGYTASYMEVTDNIHRATLLKNSGNGKTGFIVIDHGTLQEVGVIAEVGDITTGKMTVYYTKMLTEDGSASYKASVNYVSSNAYGSCLYSYDGNGDLTDESGDICSDESKGSVEQLKELYKQRFSEEYDENDILGWGLWYINQQ